MTVCDECDEGYFMIASSTQCVEECPPNLRTEEETMTCEALCEHGDFIDENKKCVSCSETYQNCEICDMDRCLVCKYPNTFDYGQ